MTRRRYLITYDVADDRRRNRVFRALEAQGDHTQYSVFVADLTDRERIALEAELESVIHRDEDQVLFADIGLADRDAGRVIGALGRPYEPPTRALVV
jgi:CRISPR-associated protein Cas2